MKVLGFCDFVPSDSAEGGLFENPPSGGLLSRALDPEAIRQAQEHDRLLAYLVERGVHLIEPEIDRLH